MLPTTHFALFTCLLATGILTSTKDDVRSTEVCENQRLNITCQGREQIMMITANYGRMSLGKCVHLDYGHLGCKQNVLSVLDKRCSGVNSCQLRVPHHSLSLPVSIVPNFDETGCPGDLKPYLHTTFKCVRVTDIGMSPLGCLSVLDARVTATSGYLSSSRGDCRMSSINYEMKASPGKRWILKLIDFSNTYQVELYARISEPGKNVTIYQGGRRGRGTSPATHQGGSTGTSMPTLRSTVVYHSLGNVINVVLSPWRSQGRYFLHYTQIGCVSPERVKGARIILLNSDLAEIKCKYTTSERFRYRLHCVRNQWQGNKINCSTDIIGFSDQKKKTQTVDFTKGLSLMLMLSIAFLISSLMLVVGLYYFKRRSGFQLTRSGDHGTAKLYHDAATYGLGGAGSLYSERIAIPESGAAAATTIAACGCATYVSRRELQTAERIVPAYFLLRDGGTTDMAGGDTPQNVDDYKPRDIMSSSP